MTCLYVRMEETEGEKTLRGKWGCYFQHIKRQTAVVLNQEKKKKTNP